MQLRALNSSPSTRHVLALAITLIFIGIPIYSLIVNGPFLWHVKQPSLYEGFAEVAILGIITYICAKSGQRIAWVLFACVCIFYTRRYGIDISILTVYLYIEGIYSLGVLFSECTRKLVKSKHHDKNIVTTAGAGLAMWLLITWLHSAIHLSNIIGIRYLAIILLGSVILLNRKDPLYRRIAQAIADISSSEPVYFALYITAFLAFFAKSSVSINFDSMWYGLQLEKSLIPSGSVFDPTGLVAPVYYYPKLYESLLLPLSKTESTSTLFGFAIFSTFLTGALLPKIWSCAQKDGTARRAYWPMLAVLCVPIFLSMSVTTGGDAFAACCFIASTYCAFQCWQERSRSWALLGLAFSIFSILSRLSALPYGTIISILHLVSFFIYRKNKEQTFESTLRVLTFGISLVVAAMVMYRSFLLAGLPFIAPDQLVAIEKHMGFTIKYPVGHSMAGSSDRSRIPFFDGLITYAFLPSHVSTTKITWAGNSWLLMPIIAILSARRRPQVRSTLLLFCIGLCGLVVLFTFKFSPRAGADGNYFIIPFLCLTLAGCNYIPSRSSSVYLVGLVATAGIFVAFLTGSWQPGTRPLDLKFDRGPEQLLSYKRSVLNRNGMSGLASYLSRYSHETRSIGVPPANNEKVKPGWLLPTRYEPASEIWWARSHILTSLSSFRNFAACTSLELVILPQREKTSSHLLWLRKKLYGYLQKLHASKEATLAYSDDVMTAWHLAPMPKVCPKITPERMIHTVTSAVLSSSSPSLSSCHPSVVTITWDVEKTYPHVQGVSIFTGTKSHQTLFTRGGRSGQAVTGPWVRPGTTFHLKSTHDDRKLAQIVIGGKSCD